MATEAEEIQTKEFLERAQIRTMGKDLQRLREMDALKERDTIIKIKPVEEIRQQGGRTEETEQLAEKKEREGILQKKAGEERTAEASLKKYAIESEKQQLFLLEAQRLEIKNQIKTIEEEKDPKLKLEKNRILLEKGDLEKKLRIILEEEKKLETEQKFISEKEKESNISSEKQSLEKRRWELEKGRQEIEKKRWEVERETAKIENKIKEIDGDSEKNVAEKNRLAGEKSKIDKTIREIYSKIITRVENERSEKEREQKLAQGKIAEIRAQEKQKIQREQWRGSPGNQSNKEKEFLKNVPALAKEKLLGQAQEEEKARKEFLENIEKWAKEKDK